MCSANARSAGTTAGGGTLRLSPGFATTLDEIDTSRRAHSKKIAQRIAIKSLRQRHNHSAKIGAVVGCDHRTTEIAALVQGRPAFQCTGCGDCCTGAPGFVWVNKEDIAALAADVGMDAEFEAQLCARDRRAEEPRRAR